MGKIIWLPRNVIEAFQEQPEQPFFNMHENPVTETKPKIDRTTPRKCKKCGQIFTPNQIKSRANYNVTFCRSCLEIKNQKRQEKSKCLYCGKQLKKGQHCFCCENHSIAYQIDNYRKRNQKEVTVKID